MRLALLLAVISPALSGVLIRGEKGTAKSTAVRALAELLPTHPEVDGSPFHLSPEEYHDLREHLEPDLGDTPPIKNVRVPVIELPIGATEDRVTGTLNLEHALKDGTRHLDPGLLAAAHRGILYVDEVNLLDDHLVDLLLDSAAMGVNTVEREGVSLSHPARFTLIGTMNPEEGELRPQFLDRFGLCVTINGSTSIAERIQIVERRLAYEDDPAGFVCRWEEESHRLSRRIAGAMHRVKDVTVPREHLYTVARTCMEAGVDGHRADIMMLRAAKALAAWHGRGTINENDLDEAAHLVLPHRMRRRPLEAIGEVPTTTTRHF
ncbi:AAA domain-containing protein [Dermatophilus congolensis]|nr:AAA domain-containing protein [Dermatophilus congolensis]MBO3149351.1 AAA domain-containing protein [Dermatophilus congolensis]